jgi:hypothetical protein
VVAKIRQWIRIWLGIDLLQRDVSYLYREISNASARCDAVATDVGHQCEQNSFEIERFRQKLAESAPPAEQHGVRRAASFSEFRAAAEMNRAKR